MCKKTTQNVTVLKDRTNGLDARGNQALNTQAESNWAIETLKHLDADKEAQTLITDELMRVYHDRKKLGFIQRTATKGFETGFEEYFGKYEQDKKTGQLKRVGKPKADPKPQDLINLMLESKYKFKDSVSWVADSVAETSPGRELRANARGIPEFQDRGRLDGRKRRNSFVGPHAGIADHVFRPEGAENFFTREVEHAKGMLEGVPTSATYQKFLAQGAPFIGGASGTIEGVALSWEAKQKLADIDDDNEREAETLQREKTIGIYMATLLAGGHHSMSEMLIAAQQFGLFRGVTDPLTDYPRAMKELGEHLAELDLPDDLAPKPGATWLNAVKKAQDEIVAIRKEISAILGGKGDDDGSSGENSKDKGQAVRSRRDSNPLLIEVSDEDEPKSLIRNKGKEKRRDSSDSDEWEDEPKNLSQSKGKKKDVKPKRDSSELLLRDDDSEDQDHPGGMVPVDQGNPATDKRKIVLQAFDKKIADGFDDLFPAETGKVLDDVVDALRSDFPSSEEITEAKEAAADAIKKARLALNSELIEGLDQNPFVPVTISKTLSDALDQVSSLTH